MFTGRNLAIFGGGHIFDRELIPEAVAKVARWESFVPTVYSDRGEPAQGYGHTTKAGPPIPGELPEWTEAYAREVLTNDLKNFAKGVDRLVKVPVSRHQFGALCSLAFNTGLTRFKTSSVLEMLNSDDPKAYTKAATKFLEYNTSKNPDTGMREVLDGLTLRRADEVSLFMTRLP